MGSKQQFQLPQRGQLDNCLPLCRGPMFPAATLVRGFGHELENPGSQARPRKRYATMLRKWHFLNGKNPLIISCITQKLLQIWHETTGKKKNHMFFWVHDKNRFPQLLEAHGSLLKRVKINRRSHVSPSRQGGTNWPWPACESIHGQGGC